MYNFLILQGERFAFSALRLVGAVRDYSRSWTFGAMRVCKEKVVMNARFEFEI